MNVRAEESHQFEIGCTRFWLDAFYGNTVGLPDEARL